MPRPRAPHVIQAALAKPRAAVHMQQWKNSMLLLALSVALGFRVLGFRGLGFRGLGFRV